VIVVVVVVVVVDAAAADDDDADGGGGDDDDDTFDDDDYDDDIDNADVDDYDDNDYDDDNFDVYVVVFADRIIIEYNSPLKPVNRDKITVAHTIPALWKAFQQRLNHCCQYYDWFLFCILHLLVKYIVAMLL